jgi:hypothetical protein
MGVDRSTIHQAFLELHRAMAQNVYSMIAENTHELDSVLVKGCRWYGSKYVLLNFDLISCAA